ncbi:MAG TPA: thioesterase family protein [Spongiibacteraceae bacterium]
MTAQTDSKKILFTTDIEVRWGDLDFYNHVNNVHYFRYLEEARMRWMTHHRLAEIGMAALPVMLKADITFLKSVRYPATLRVITYLDESGFSSLSLSQKIFDAATLEVCYAEGYSKLVWLDQATGKSTALPPYVLNALEQ